MSEISSNVPELIFGESKLPICPLLWIYGNCAFPTVSTLKMEKDTFFEKFGDCVHKITDIEKHTQYSHVDYFEVVQEYFPTNIVPIQISDCQSIMITFHLWIYNCDNPTVTDITNVNYCRNLSNGIFAFNLEQIIPQSIGNNSLTPSSMSIHDTSLSPGGSSTFLLNIDRKTDKPIEINFFSIAVYQNLMDTTHPNKCCITKHKLIIYPTD